MFCPRDLPSFAEIRELTKEIIGVEPTAIFTAMRTFEVADALAGAVESNLRHQFDLSIGRFAMVGMGSLVTKSVEDFHLVIGHPARPIGCVCRCGHPLIRFDQMATPEVEVSCSVCGLPYRIAGQQVEELDPPR